MKIVTLFLLLVVVQNLFAQKSERYCIVELKRDAIFSKKELYITIDSGQAEFRNRQYAVDSAGKLRDFETEVKAMNFIGSMGWKIVPFKPEFEDVFLQKGTFLFRKEE